MAWTVSVEGLDRLQELEEAGRRVRTSASRALNTTATRQRTRAASLIRNQVAFPASYLQPGGGRLVVSRKASPANLEARITGRERPTSLSRFLTGRPKLTGRNRSGVSVQVKPGSLRRLPRAFAVRLRAGSSLTETRFNVGLAIRLPRGETVRNRRRTRRGPGGLTLLYSVSVQQTLLDNAGRGVALTIERSAADEMEAEFLRLLNL